MTKLLPYFGLLLLSACSSRPSTILPIPSTQPSEAQQQQIKRQYGMFIHFGINTFHDMEWTDGSQPAMSYNPAAIDAEQWVQTAKNAGMKYVILITKHHDGFCLWDSRQSGPKIIFSRWTALLHALGINGLHESGLVFQHAGYYV